jgi:hypothetical protein
MWQVCPSLLRFLAVYLTLEFSLGDQFFVIIQKSSPSQKRDCIIFCGPDKNSSFVNTKLLQFDGYIQVVFGIFLIFRSSSIKV